MSRSMSRLLNGIAGIVTASLALGAVHLEIASGGDLKASRPNGDASLSRGTVGAVTQPQLAAHDVNRSAKADRAGQALPGSSGPTIVFTLAGMSNTSVATYTPIEAKPTPPGPSGNAERGRPIMNTAACEPPVSALTELARHIETGRCVT